MLAGTWTKVYGYWLSKWRGFQRPGIVGAYTCAWVIRCHFLFHPRLPIPSSWAGLLTLLQSPRLSDWCPILIALAFRCLMTHGSFKGLLVTFVFAGTRCQPNESLPDDAPLLYRNLKCERLFLICVVIVKCIASHPKKNPIFINTTKIDYFSFLSKLSIWKHCCQKQKGNTQREREIIEEEEMGKSWKREPCFPNDRGYVGCYDTLDWPSWKTPNQYAMGSVFVKHIRFFSLPVFLMACDCLRGNNILDVVLFGCCAVWWPGRCILYRPSLFTFAGCRPYETSHTHSPRGRICESFNLKA